MLENNGTSYTVAAEVWTNPVQPNSTMTIGFVGSKAADVEAALSNFRLTEVVIGEGTPVIPIDPPVEDIEISASAALQENGDIAVSWTSNKQEGTFDILTSADGVNFTSVGTVTGVSEYLYTPESDFETLYFKVVQTVSEQSAQSNVVSVVNNKPSEDIVISANGAYDEESGDITVSWETNTDNGSFEIFMSEDGEEFVSIGTVTDVSEYVYDPATDFEEIYFKVIQTAGNKSAESNIVTVESNIVLSVITSANYDEENGNIKVSWITSFDKGTYEIFVSEDDENFTSLGVVENTKEYIYTPEGEFTVLYFKVKQTVGKLTAESESVSVNHSINWGDKTDTDNDGLPDVYEKYYFYTELSYPDTDDDGLPDGYEVYYLGTDPKKADSDENGTSDGDEDFDGDGLSNKREYELGTDSNTADTDNDGLSDSDEVNTYNTDPLKYDTDEDGISDADEIALGLDPTGAATDGIADSERTFVQHVGADSENFAVVNTDENPFEVSIDITAAGVAANNLHTQKSGYSNAIKNDAILGITPEFTYTDGLKVEDVIINFTIDNSAVNNYNNKYTDISDEFVGIKRLNVFKYFEDVNMLLPIETFHDVENNRVYTHTDELGTYCLMDMEIWLENLGITAEGLAENTEAAVFSARSMPVAYSDDAEDSEQEEQKYLDVVLVPYPGSFLIDETKSELRITSEEIFKCAAKENLDARIYFIDFLGGSIKTSDGKLYAETFEEAVSIINKQPAINSGHSETSFALYKALNYVNSTIVKEFRPDSKRFCFVIDVGGYPATDISLGAVPALKENDVIIGFSYNRGNTNADKYMLLATNAICEQAVIGSGRYNFGDFLVREIFGNHENEYPIVSAVGWSRINLDAPITKEYRDYSLVIKNDPSLLYDIIKEKELADTDGDELYDFQEIMFETEKGNDLITFDASGDVVLPNFEDCTGALPWNRRLFYVEEGLRRYADLAVFQDLYKIRILPIKSDPTSEDSDSDGIDDEEETFIGTSCLSIDTDKDGLDDCTEYINWYDPLDPNPDGDIYNDYEEFVNGTDPYALDFTTEAWAAEFVKGVVAGDIIEDPSIPALFGQIAGGVAPGVGTVADVRDTIVNAARGDWFMAGMSAIGIVPIGGDISKVATNITQFIAKNSDDASQIAELIIAFSKKSSTTFARTRVSFDDLIKIIPASSLDELIDAFKKSNMKISREFYLQVAEVAKKEGKKIPTILDNFPEATIKNVDKDLWDLPWILRGDAIDELLGNKPGIGLGNEIGLGHNYKTYDVFKKDTGIATSIKSIDPMCKSCRDVRGFENRLNRCLDQLDKGANTVFFEGGNHDVLGKALNLALPDVPISNEHLDVLNNFIKKSKQDFNIEVIVTIVKSS